MKQSVVDIFPSFTKPLEGCVLWPYQDVLGLVTVGYGCLIDPESLAASVPGWYLSTPAYPASPAAIAQEWAKVKAFPKALHFKLYEKASVLRLSEEGVDHLLALRMQTFEGTLRHYFPDWDAFPADAQLAIMAMAWACGAGFPAVFKNFTHFANQHDWLNAAKCAAIRTDGNPGVVPRNAQVQLCLANAANVNDHNLDASHLFWPAQSVGAVKDPGLPLAVMAQQALAAHPIDVLGYAGRGDPFTGHESDVAA